jgi:hypothetical protein
MACYIYVCIRRRASLLAERRFLRRSRVICARTSRMCYSCCHCAIYKTNRCTYALRAGLFGTAAGGFIMDIVTKHMSGDILSSSLLVTVVLTISEITNMSSQPFFPCSLSTCSLSLSLFTRTKPLAYMVAPDINKMSELSIHTMFLFLSHTQYSRTQCICLLETRPVCVAFSCTRYALSPSLVQSPNSH